MKRKLVMVVLLTICMAVMLTGCIPGDGSYKDKPAGFFSGLWHGCVAPISLIIGIFNPDIRVYEKNNTGWWYDFGFLLVVGGGCGGGGMAAKRRRDRRKREENMDI